MTTPSLEFSEYVLEFLEPILPIKTGRFFGGVGISCHSVQFAMIMGNSLYFVVDDESRKKYQQAGMRPFSYSTKKGEIQVRRYFEVPEEILTDIEQLQLWANEAVGIAGKSQRNKVGRKNRLSSTKR